MIRQFIISLLSQCIHNQFHYVLLTVLTLMISFSRIVSITVNVPFVMLISDALAIETNMNPFSTLHMFRIHAYVQWLVIAVLSLLFLSLILQTCIVRCVVWTMFGCDMKPESTHVDSPRVYPKEPSFNIEDKYKETAAVIYAIIIELDIPDMPCCVASIIAEYGATIYTECVECKKAFGFIECYRDIEWNNDRNIVLFSATGDIVYYLCCEVRPDMLEDHDYNYEAKGINQILCYECGSKWRCGMCSYQTFTWNYEEELIPGGCYYCKQNICDDEDCSLYVESRKIGICATCYWDEAICDVDVDENGIILDVLN